MAKRDLAKAVDDKAVAEKPKTALAAACRMLKDNQDYLQKTLPNRMDADRFINVVSSLLRRTPELANCVPATVAGAAFQAAALGFEPGPLGHCYLIPYGNRHTGQKEAQMQLGYKGLLALAYRSGEISSVACKRIHEHDHYQIIEGTDAKIIHEPELKGDRGKVVIYYCVIKTQNGGTFYDWMTRPEVESHRNKFSKGAASGPWKDHFDAMADKTVLKQALKLAPLSIDFQSQLVKDGTVTREIPQKEEDFDAVEIVDAEVVMDESDQAPGDPDEMPISNENPPQE